MMQFIRDHSNSVWAKILLVGVGVSLAGIGGTQIFSGPSADTVATVNGQKVILQEVEAQYQQLLNANTQGDLTEDVQRQYKLIARQDLLQRRALDSQIKDWKVRVSDKAVAEEIISIPAFQLDGVFDQETYKTALFYSGYNIETFEEAIRRDLEERIVREALVNSAFVPEKELNAQIAFLGQKRDLEIATYNYLEGLDSIAVSEDEVQKKYDQAADQYKTPNLVKLQYIELAQNAIALEGQPSFSSEEISAEAESLKQQNEQRLSEQFTIEFSNVAEKNDAIDVLNDLKAQLESGEMTIDEAKNEIAQIDNAYYNQNGNFKYGAAGIPAFDDALFSLTEKAPFSSPFDTDGEVHMIHLLKISSPYANEDALVTAAEQSLQDKRKNDAYMAKEVRMQELAETYTESLGEIAQDLGLKMQETAWLNFDVQEGLLANPSVWTALNTYDVTDNHKNSLPFAFNGQADHAMIVRIADKEESRSKTLEESYDEIKTELAKNRAKEEMTNQVNAMLESGDVQSFQNDIEQLGFAYNQYNDLAITSVGQLQTKPVEQFAISNGFQKVHTLENDAPQYLVEDIDGHIAVIAVNAINSGNIDDLAESDQNELQEYLQGREATVEYQALMKYLFNNSKITIYNNGFFE
ncbi:peptidylprolyl isomerase [Ignatzschineria sp. LJL83]